MGDSNTTTTQQPTQQSVDPIKQITDLLRENQELKKSLETISAKDNEVKATVAKLQEEVSLSESQKKELEAKRSQDKITNEVKLSALKHGAKYADDVVRLTSSEFAVVNDKVVVAAKPELSAEDHIKAWLDQRPEYKVAQVQQGSGTPPFPGTAPATRVLDLSTSEGKTAFARSLGLGNAHKRN